MATSIHPSIPVLSPSFLYHPYIPSFQSKDFSFTCNIIANHYLKNSYNLAIAISGKYVSFLT